MTWARWVPLAVIILLSGLFAYFNGGERVSLSLGFAQFYRLSLVGVTFGAFILGMISMFLIGLRHDLRIRKHLRERQPSAPETPRQPPPVTEWTPPV
ncbi:MAG: LapA family protein [Gemmatimonadetes bacterium]|jgi:uncharacterized integral membrane protein|nr:LapA family protein [Gemmatimonadota bacterium]